MANGRSEVAYSAEVGLYDFGVEPPSISIGSDAPRPVFASEWLKCRYAWGSSKLGPCGGERRFGYGESLGTLGTRVRYIHAKVGDFNAP